MRVELSRLNAMKLDELPFFYATIPVTETVVEIHGEFAQNHGSSGMAHLPKHIKTVILSGYYRRFWRHRYDPTDARKKIRYKDGLISNALGSYVVSLPSSVKEIVFRLGNDDPEVTFDYKAIDGLIKALTLLPKSIEVVDLTGVDLTHVMESSCSILRLFNSVSSIKTFKFTFTPFHLGSTSWLWLTKWDYDRNIQVCLLALPKSLESVYLDDCELFERVNHAYWDKKLFSALGRQVKRLSLRGNHLDRVSDAHLPQMMSHLPDLRALDIGRNNLWTKSAAALGILFANLPPNLEILGLSDNNSEEVTMTLDEIATTLSRLPPSIVELDLGDDCFLHFNEPSMLKQVLLGLPLTVKRLRLCSPVTTEVTGAHLALYLAQLPPQIETFIVSRNQLLGLSIPEFLIAMQGLPETVHTLDLSDSDLNQRSGEELTLLFAGLPPHIKRVKLNHNQLASLDLSILRQGFAAFAKTVIEIDLADNGFNHLPRTVWNQLAPLFPATVERIILDANQFGIRNDGALMPYALPAHPGVLKLQHSVRLNQAFVDSLILWMQFFQAIDADVVVTHLILSFLLKDTPQQLHVKAQQLSAGLISVAPPDELTLSVQEKTCLVVQTRINDLTPQDSRLDLSRCGLNRITRVDVFESMLDRIPEPVQSLSLRANGFNCNEPSLNLFIGFLGTIPKTIRYLDLSGNGFEHFSADELEALFIHLPPTVELVSLGTEKPMSPALQIKQRRWPESYQTLTKETPALMQKAQQLLNDYTQNSSWFKRLSKGHWNRHHIDAVAKIEDKIRLGAITNEEDLQQAFEEIPGIKPDGSLARRLSFLFHSKPQPLKPAPTDNEMIKALEDEPSTELSLHPH